jgi:hypothetical protein
VSWDNIAAEQYNRLITYAKEALEKADKADNPFVKNVLLSQAKEWNYCAEQFVMGFAIAKEMERTEEQTVEYFKSLLDEQ